MTGSSPDVLVVGGGPAGLATAIACRQRDLQVRVLDRASPPADKACGEGLMPGAVQALRALDVSLHDLQGIPFRGIRYIDGEISAVADFHGAGGLGVRRTRLHRTLVRAARDCGARLSWGVGVRRVTPEGEVEIAGGRLRAAHVVAADGLHSPIRRAAGLSLPSRLPGRFGVRRHFRCAPWTEHVEVHWADAGEAYVTPVGRDRVGLALLTSRPAPFETLLARFPSLERRLQGVPAGPTRGAGPFHRPVRAVRRGRLALVGDAAGYVDAITGEGLAAAFHQAQALAEALQAGSLAGYASAHGDIVRRSHRSVRRLLFWTARPSRRRRLIRALARDPRLFSALVQDLASPRGAEAALSFRLMWRLACA